MEPTLAFNLLKGMLVEYILANVPRTDADMPLFRAKVDLFNETSRAVERALATLPKPPTTT